MAYCVKCGVELDESATRCALCDTPVYMPNVNSDETPTPFAKESAIPKGIKSKFIALIITVLMVIPCIACTTVNLFARSYGYWCVYVVCSVALIWIIAVFPFITNKPRPYLMWAFDSAAVLFYVYVFFPMQKENPANYLTIALPIILAASGCSLFFIIWAKRKPRHWTEVMILILADILFMCVITISVFFLKNIKTGMIISIIIALSDVILIAFGLYCNKSKRMRTWMKKKFFI